MVVIPACVLFDVSRDGNLLAGKAAEVIVLTSKPSKTPGTAPSLKCRKVANCHCEDESSRKYDFLGGNTCTNVFLCCFVFPPWLWRSSSRGFRLAYIDMDPPNYGGLHREAARRRSTWIRLAMASTDPPNICRHGSR